MTLSRWPYALFVALLCAAQGVPAQAAPASYDYAGQTLDDLKRKGVQNEALSPSLEVVSNYGFSAPQIAWVTHANGLVTGTLSYWATSCSALATGNAVRWEQKGTLRAAVYHESGATLTQLGEGCWVAYGADRAQRQVQAELLSLSTDQALPHRNRSRTLEQAVDQLRLFRTTPVSKGPSPHWGKLQAGQVASPEEAAKLTGFEDAKVSNRDSSQGVGYVLKCGSPTVKGKTGLLVLHRETSAALQFAVFLPNETANAELSRLNRELGPPAVEDQTSGRKTYVWLSDKFKTTLSQQPEGDWLFRWQPLSETPTAP